LAWDIFANRKDLYTFELASAYYSALVLMEIAWVDRGNITVKQTNGGKAFTTLQVARTTSHST
jgi:hypothetical protein